MAFVLIILGLLSGELVLTNGKRASYRGEYVVDGNFVKFENPQGELVQLPLKLVDLEKTQAHNAPKPKPAVVEVAKPLPPKAGTYASALDAKRTTPLVIDGENMRHYAQDERFNSFEVRHPALDEYDSEWRAVIDEYSSQITQVSTPNEIRDLYQEIVEDRSGVLAVLRDVQRDQAEVKRSQPTEPEDQKIKETQIRFYSDLLFAIESCLEAMDQIILELKAKAAEKRVRL